MSTDRFEQTQSSLHTYSLASKYFSKETLQDEGIHNLRIVYDPSGGFNGKNFKENHITKSEYLSKLIS